MENHHFLWKNPLCMAIFNCYVSSPEGIIRDLYRSLKLHFITVLETFSIIKFATTLQRSFVLEVAERDPAIFK